MDKQSSIKVVETFIANPKLLEFGHNVPSRAVFLKKCEGFTKNTVLNSGAKIAKNVTAHWENTKLEVELKADPENGVFEFALPANFEGFFSISWAINDEIIQEYDKKNIISLGFEDCQIGKKALSDVEIFGNITLIKGKNTDKKTCAAGLYEERLQASFNMEEQSEMWKCATRGWMDLVITPSEVRKIKLVKPMIWIQSKMSV